MRQAFLKHPFAGRCFSRLFAAPDKGSSAHPSLRRQLHYRKVLI